MSQPVQTQQDLLNYLRNLRSRLLIHDDDIVHLLQGDQGRLHNYELYKASLDGVIDRLENNLFKTLDQQLAAAAASLTAGTANLDAELQSLNHAIQLINAFTAVVDLAVRVVALAAK